MWQSFLEEAFYGVLTFFKFGGHVTSNSAYDIETYVSVADYN